MENKKDYQLTLMEFQELWFIAERDVARQEGRTDYNVIVDVNGTEIVGDDYYVMGDKENPLIILSYKGHKTGEIYLKFIRLVY